MISYRKKGTRLFYKIYDNGNICRVFNRERFSSIDISNNELIIADGKDEKECTEQEFRDAYKYAFDRISLQNLDI